MSDEARIRRRTRVAVAVMGAVLLAGLAVLALGVTRDPIEAQRSTQNWRLQRLGLERHAVETPAGPVWVWEGGRGPTLLMVHGFLADGSGWADLAPALLPHMHLVIVDLPGHGDSGPPPAGAVTLDDWVSAIDAVADAATTGMVVPVGHSLGALAALRFAADRPDKVWKVVLVAPPTDADPEALSLATVDEARDVVARMFPGVDDIPAFLAEALVERRAQPRVEALVRSLAAIDPETWALGVEAPTWVVRAANDGMVSEAEVARIATALPDAHAVALPDCGHVPQTLCPEPLAEAILDAVLDPRARR